MPVESHALSGVRKAVTTPVAEYGADAGSYFTQPVVASSASVPQLNGVPTTMAELQIVHSAPRSAVSALRVASCALRVAETIRCCSSEPDDAPIASRVSSTRKIKASSSTTPRWRVRWRKPGCLRRTYIEKCSGIGGYRWQIPAPRTVLAPMHSKEDALLRRVFMAVIKD